MEVKVPHIGAELILTVLIVAYMLVREIFMWKKRKRGENLTTVKEELARHIDTSQASVIKAHEATDRGVIDINKTLREDHLRVARDARDHIMKLIDDMKERRRDHLEVKTVLKDLCDAIREDTKIHYAQAQENNKVMASLDATMKLLVNQRAV